MRIILVLMLLMISFPAFAAQDISIVDYGDESATVTNSRLDVNVNLPGSITADTVILTQIPRAIAASQSIYRVTIRNGINNTDGNVWIGSSALNFVGRTETLTGGYRVVTGESVIINTDNLTDIYAVATVTNNTIDFIAEIR